MARWFGVGLLAIGLTTWLARDAAASAGGLAIAQALAVSYGIGVVLALWGTLAGPFNALGWIAVALNLLLGAGFACSPAQPAEDPAGGRPALTPSGDVAGVAGAAGVVEAPGDDAGGVDADGRLGAVDRRRPARGPRSREAARVAPRRRPRWPRGRCGRRRGTSWWRRRYGR